MRFNNRIIQTLFLMSIQWIQRRERLIKAIEYTRGLYRHPNKMLGRRIPARVTGYQSTDILVFAAHPDDDVLGLGTTLYRHSLNQEKIKVIFITNGTGRGGESWNVKVSDSNRKWKTRYEEAIRALSCIHIPKEHLYFLGYPDGGTQRYVKDMSADILRLIQELKPGRIYVHCIEGGHRDHDITGFTVKSVCKNIGYSHVFEWTQYRPDQPLGAPEVTFLDDNSNEEIRISITEEERMIKRRMLACHHSQDVEQFFLQGEAIRQADISQFEMELSKHGQFQKRKLVPILKGVLYNEDAL